jgi:Mg-chelatase subunit ChlD
MKKILKLTTIVALIAQSVFLSPLASAAIDEPTSANPALPSGVCGLDIVLVMDQSQSMSAGEMSDQKESFKSIINEFAGIPTQFAVTKFSNRSQVVSQFTDDTAALIASIDAIANNSPAGESNWDAALTTARNRFDPRADKPDLIIFATDGIANRYKTNNNPSRDCDGSSAAACDAAYNHAIRAANLAKTDGVRILGVGQ